ncbi:ADP-ribosylation factor-like protein 14 [Sorex araneus]|uniref:ADP-ribosylation factor-like protein 14 n=1 Tax=Sorex araneus TaxID=42254 RepID=UPI00033179D3|nr:ADP-ribosylation factor-like protein 14 [Sorex araneus]
MGPRSSKGPEARQARVLLLGLDLAGKSALLYRLARAQRAATLPTVGFNVETLEWAGGLQLTLWDVGGQEKMRRAWDCFCEGADGLLYVVDCADPQRLDASRRALESVLQSEHLRHVPLVLLANKQDVPGALGAEDITRRFRVHKLCADRSWYVQPCSAVTGDGLAQGLQKLVAFVKSRRKARGALAFFRPT